MCARTIPALVPRGRRQRGRTADGRARARHVGGTQKGYSSKGTHGVLRRYCAHHIVTHAALFRMRVTVSVGLSGEYTAVCPTPA